MSLKGGRLKYFSFDIYVFCVLYQYNNIAHSIFIVMYDEDFLKASWYDETQSFSR